MLRSEAKLVPVTADHVQHVAAHIREADRVEVYEFSRRSPARALADAVRRSDRSATLLIDGQPAAVLGVARRSLLSTTGTPWGLGTDAVTEKPRAWWPLCKGGLARMMQTHDVLENYVHDANIVSMRWLSSMGFDIGPSRPLGWRGAGYRKFVLCKENVQHV